MSDNAKGALYMMGAMLAFMLNDTMMKLVLADVPLFQALALRGAGTTLVLLAIAWGSGRRPPLAWRDRWLVGIRSAAEAMAAALYIGALSHLPLANASAILLTLPLTVTLAGALFLHEPVGWRRLAAICLGFVGVLLIVRPGRDGFNIYTIPVLGAVVMVTLREIVTRKLSASVPSLPVAIATGLAGTAIGLAGSVTISWQPLSAQAWTQLAAATGFFIVGSLLAIPAMRVGDIGFVTPFRYTSLIFALVVGLIVFGDWPGRLTLLGAVIIVGTGLFTLLRERRLHRGTASLATRTG